MRSDRIHVMADEAKEGRFGPMEHSLIEHAVTVIDEEGRAFDGVDLDTCRVLASQQDQVYDRLLKFARLVEGYCSQDSAGHMRWLRRQARLALEMPLNACPRQIAEHEDGCMCSIPWEPLA